MAASTPKMGLYTWNKPLDPYDFNQLTNNWNIVDFHDHTEGRGTQIPMGGIAPGAVGPLQLSFVASQIGSWTSLVSSLTAGYIALSSGYAPSGRVEGNNDIVRLKGGITNNTGASAASGTILATLPTALRPSSTVYVSVALSPSANTYLNITTGGAIYLAAAMPSGASLLLDGITYTLS